ncbi:hypothetical protein IPG36_06905 [bacterium]|nr:MAG: hypothetical protein IPG36_06905 [bacterium]
MVLSRLFLHHKSPEPQFAPALFLLLLTVFTVVVQIKPILGLAGLGTTAVLASCLVLINRKQIWEEYLKAYHKRRGLAGALTAPSNLYYVINVAFLWPLILFLGVCCLYIAWVIS